MVRIMVKIDEDECIGCESCVELCPEIFGFDADSAKAYVITPKEGIRPVSMRRSAHVRRSASPTINDSRCPPPRGGCGPLQEKGDNGLDRD
jgi:ferredoxin